MSHHHHHPPYRPYRPPSTSSSSNWQQRHCKFFSRQGHCINYNVGTCPYLHVVCQNEPGCARSNCRYGHPSRAIHKTGGGGRARDEDGGETSGGGGGGGEKQDESPTNATNKKLKTMTIEGRDARTSKEDESGNLSRRTNPNVFEKSGRSGGYIYAIDCEFITVCSKKGRGGYEATTQRRAVVSVGVVDTELEVVLYARVRKPQDTTVLDDTFVRTVGGLSSNNGGWDKGIHAMTVRTLLKNFVVNEGGTLVGWSMHNDLEALGLNIPTSRMIDLAEIFQTRRGKKCQLSEAFRHVFSRDSKAHNAGDDAKMTMELYNYWVKNGQSARIVVPLHWYCIRWSNFSKGPAKRYEILWTVLRPDRMDRQVVVACDKYEETVGTGRGGAHLVDDTFSLRFRTSADREAYLHRVLRRVQSCNRLKLVESPTTNHDGSVVYTFDSVIATLQNLER